MNKNFNKISEVKRFNKSKYVIPIVAAIIAGIFSLYSSKPMQDNSNSLNTISTINQTGGLNIISDKNIEYYDDSKFDFKGLPFESNMTGVIFYNSLSTLITLHLNINENSLISWSCDAKAVSSYESAIKLDPRFPFAYYYLGICEKDFGNIKWIADITTAKNILEITTNIPGHNPGQDVIFADVKKLLSDNN